MLGNFYFRLFSTFALSHMHETVWVRQLDVLHAQRCNLILSELHTKQVCACQRTADAPCDCVGHSVLLSKSWKCSRVHVWVRLRVHSWAQALLPSAALNLCSEISLSKCQPGLLKQSTVTNTVTEIPRHIRRCIWMRQPPPAEERAAVISIAGSVAGHGQGCDRLCVCVRAEGG